VFALKSGKVREASAAKPAGSNALSLADRFVLPRLLRRPVRIFARLGCGDYCPPRFSASILTVGFLSASALYGAYVGGHMPAVVQSITARTGFAVDQVRVLGHRETSEIDVLERLELDGWTSLIGFNADLARDRIAQLPWVEAASVRKVYPDTLEVRIEEREPFAIWQHGSDLTLIEKSGRQIAPFASGRHASLPLVIGDGAADKAAGFIEKVRRYPEISGRVKGYIRVADRRWDLRLENGITIKLPELGEDEAIASVVRMDHDDGLLSRDIAGVDLRLSDRLVIQLTPEAAERREAALAEQSKPGKRKPERKI
jgi:cell division protein FtsQ